MTQEDYEDNMSRSSIHSIDTPSNKGSLNIPHSNTNIFKQKSQRGNNGSNKSPANKQQNNNEIVMINKTNNVNDVSYQTLMNINAYEDLNFSELRQRLEDELSRNEHLESKIRQMEFNVMCLEGENRRLKNNNNNQDNDQSEQKRKESFGKIGSINNEVLFDGQVIEQLESKLTQYENDIVSLKDREAELISQINSLRGENFDLKLKTERFSIILGNPLQFNNQDNVINNNTKEPQRNRSSNLPPLYTQRATLINNSIINSQQRQTNTINNLTPIRRTRCSFMPLNNVEKSGINSFNIPKGLQFGQQRMTTQRMSIRMSIASQGNGMDMMPELELLQDINEAKQVIIQMKQEKDILEYEIQNTKEKAIEQIIQKEHKIIELIKYYEEQIDELRKQSSKLQLDISQFQKTDRQKDGQDNQQFLKFERQIQALTQENQYCSDKYETLHQKYLEERRNQDTEKAYLEDKYQKDTQYYQNKIEKQKDQIRQISQEMEKLRSKYLQSQDFKQEIIRDIEDYEQRIRENDNDKNQLEKDFLYKIEIKNEIIQDKTFRIQELQDQLYKIDEKTKQLQAEDYQVHQQELNLLKDQLANYDNQLEDQDLEIMKLRDTIQNLESSLLDLEKRNGTLQGVIKDLQDQDKQLELTYNEKMEQLEDQMSIMQNRYHQQILSLKTHISVLEQNGGTMIPLQSLRSEMTEVQECQDEENSGTNSQEQSSSNRDNNQFYTLSTQNASSPQQQYSTQNAQDKFMPKSLMDELCEDNLGEQRFSVLQGSPNKNNIMYQGAYSPRYSMASSQYYQQQNLNDERQTINSQGLSGVNKFQQNSEFIQQQSPNKSQQNTQNKELQNLLLLKEQEILTLQQDIQSLQSMLTDKDEELDEFEDQLKIYEQEIQKLYESKQEQSQRFDEQTNNYRQQLKQYFTDLQTMRKQQIAQNRSSDLSKLQTRINSLQVENQTLKRKIKLLDREIEDLTDSLISQKSQYMSEKNYLRIQLTQVEDKIMQGKLKEAQVLMEKDMISMKLKESMGQVKVLRDAIDKMRNNRKGGETDNGEGSQKKGLVLQKKLSDMIIQ